MKPQKLILYQFPISHYCEKVRWTLDYKQLEYEVKNLIPGLHVATTKKLSSQTAVPILHTNQSVIHGSSRIISYLDKNFPERNLTPEQSHLRDQAIEWGNYADREIGIHLRLYYYHVLLDYPNIVIPFLTHNGPWYGKLFLKIMFPKIKKRMKGAMNINSKSAQRSKAQLKTAIDKIYHHLQEHKFLAGNQFTRADLTATSLLAPLCRPTKYGLNWPDRFPEPLETLVDECSEKTMWVNEFYEQYR